MYKTQKDEREGKIRIARFKNKRLVYPLNFRTREYLKAYQHKLASEQMKLDSIYKKTKKLEKKEQEFFQKLSNTKQMENKAFELLQGCLNKSFKSQKTRLLFVSPTGDV